MSDQVKRPDTPVGMFDVPKPTVDIAEVSNEGKPTGFYYAAAIQYIPEGAEAPIWSTEMVGEIKWRQGDLVAELLLSQTGNFRAYAETMIAKWNQMAHDIRYSLLTQVQLDSIQFGIEG